MKKIYLGFFCLIATIQITFASTESQLCIRNVIEQRNNNSQLLLNNCNIEDADLNYVIHFLNQHAEIRELYLDNNKVSDVGAKQLAKLNIDYLSIDNNQITAVGA